MQMVPQKSAEHASLLNLTQTAVAASHAAGQILMKRFRTRLRVNEKPGQGLVTNADFESEKAAIKVLSSAFPDFGILTEESDGRKARGLGRWILDPLDGTANYAHGLSTFCVSIAAEWGGEIVAGVVHHPVPGDTYIAMLGKGAFVFQGKPDSPAGQRLRVSPTSKLRDSFLSTGFSSRKDLWLTRELAVFARVSRLASGVRRPGSAALDLAQVARGSFDGFWERGLSAWDVAAGSLLITEAGGKVTGFKGKPLQMNSGEILASNGTIHRALMREIGV